MATVPLRRRALAELVGTAFLVAVVVGSGIAAQRLTADGGVQLLCTAVATALGLTVLILAVGPVSGAHLNPVVSLADRLLGGMSGAELATYVAAQTAGGAAGCIVANLMFTQPAVTWSTTPRAGFGTWLAEVVATLGLVLVVLALVRSGRTTAVAPAVGGYIGSAYFFTASTSFANPAVTAGRTLTDTLAGIAPADAPAFAACQVLGGLAGVGLARLFYPDVASAAPLVVPTIPEQEPPDG